MGAGTDNVGARPTTWGRGRECKTEPECRDKAKSVRVGPQTWGWVLERVGGAGALGQGRECRAGLSVWEPDGGQCGREPH